MPTEKQQKKEPWSQQETEKENERWQPGHGARHGDQGGPESQGKEKQGRRENPSGKQSKGR